MDWLMALFTNCAIWPWPFDNFFTKGNSWLKESPWNTTIDGKIMIQSFFLYMCAWRVLLGRSMPVESLNAIDIVGSHNSTVIKFIKLVSLSKFKYNELDFYKEKSIMETSSNEVPCLFSPHFIWSLPTLTCSVLWVHRCIGLISAISSLPRIWYLI